MKLHRLIYPFAALSFLLSASVFAAAPDKTAPSVPTGLAASNLSGTGFTLTWNASTDNVGVTGYEVFLNAVSQGTVTTTSKTFTSLQAGTTYSATVRARDAAGNWSAQSAPLAVTPINDVTPPSVPTNLGATLISSSGFTVTWAASTDNVGVTAYEVFLQGISRGTVATTSMALSGLVANSTYSVTVRARDGAGNWSAQSTPLSVTTLVDTTPPVATPTLSGGSPSSAFLRADGKVYVWGFNYYGEFGNGTKTQNSAPTYISAWGTVKQVATGDGTVMVLRTDGTVWSAGQGGFGELGNGKAADSSVPVQASGLTGGASIAAGGYAAYAIKTDGTLWAWGYNGYGQLGDGTTTNRSAPVRVLNLTNVAAVSGGSVSCLALTADGKVWAWGANFVTSGNTLTATQVQGLPTIQKIVSGGGFALALDTTGRVWSWGANYLGDGTPNSRATPAVLSGLPTIKAIYSGPRSETAIVVATDDTAYVWGRNDFGQARPPASAQVLSPVPFAELGTILSASTAATAGYAIQSNGLLRSWGGFTGDSVLPGGNAADPRLGDASVPIGTVPVPLHTMTNFAKIAVGGAHGLLVDKTNALWSFGVNTSGQLGDGTTTEHMQPKRVTSLSGVSQARASGGVSAAVMSDGKLWMWGDNRNATLGDGTLVDRSTPIQVTGLPATVRSVDMVLQTLAVLSNGEVWGWGSDTYGQVGAAMPPLGYVSAPVKVNGITGATAVAAGPTHSIALLSNGTVMQWGSVTGGFTPTAVSRLSGVQKIAAGQGFSLALLTTGTISAWGDNTSGQLGIGNTTSTTRPTQVVGLTGIIDIAASSYHSIALKNDGTVWIWGDGITTPIRLGTIADAAAISAGASFAVVRADTRAWISGYSLVTSRAQSLDNMLHQIANVRLAATVDDSDGDGLPDAWEMANFGSLSQGGAVDSDSDGVSNVQEYVLSATPNAIDSDADGVPDWLDAFPNDYYNGALPTLTILSGDNQKAQPSTFDSLPLDVAVWTPDGSAPYVNAPIAFNVTQGGGLISLATSGSPLASSISLLTDVDGTAKVYFKQPTTAGVISTITATAGQKLVAFTSTSITAIVDTDGDGMPDDWETSHGLNPQVNDANLDPDGDGITNLQEYQLGSDPQDYYNNVLPTLTSLVVNNLPGTQGQVSVRITRTSDGTPLLNSPATFNVTNGNSPIAATPGGTLAATQSVRADSQGVATVFLGEILYAPETILVTVNSGSQQRQLTLLLSAPLTDDADGNGLPDWWEVKYFGHTGVSPTADPDVDGASNAQEYQRGTSPIVANPVSNDAAAALKLYTPLSR
jgi:alpha-tubulin suppressor-like RCC1 family protein